MRGYGELVKTLAKSTLREPVGFFFSIVFAPALVIILGTIFGNEPTADFGGRGYLDETLPAFASLVLAIMGVMTMPQALLTLRESGALRRFQLTPLRPTTWLASNFTVYAALAYVGMLLALGTGTVGFGVPLPSQLVAVLLACLLGLAAFLALGFVLAALYPSSGAAVGIGNVLMILLMITSGAFVPLEVMPEGIRATVHLSPISKFVDLVGGLWDGQSWAELAVPTLVLVGMTLICGTLGAILFRWTPRQS